MTLASRLALRFRAGSLNTSLFTTVLSRGMSTEYLRGQRLTSATSSFHQHTTVLTALRCHLLVILHQFIRYVEQPELNRTTRTRKCIVATVTVTDTQQQFLLFGVCGPAEAPPLLLKLQDDHEDPDQDRGTAMRLTCIRPHVCHDLIGCTSTDDDIGNKSYV